MLFSLSMKLFTIIILLISLPLNLLAKDYYCFSTSKELYGESTPINANKFILSINDIFNTASVEWDYGKQEKLNWIKDSKIYIWIGVYDKYEFRFEKKIFYNKFNYLTLTLLNDHPLYYDYLNAIIHYTCQKN